MSKYKCIKNAVGYVMVLLFFLACFIIFHSYFFLVAMVVWIALAVADVISLHSLKENVIVKLKGKPTDCYKNIKTGIRVSVENNSYFFSHNIYLKLVVENEFYGEKSYHTINLPVAAKQRQVTEFPVEFLTLGKMKITLEEIRIGSMLGILEGRKQLKEELFFYVFPKEMGSSREVEKYEGIRERVEEKEEEGRKKGYDFSEMMGIREYIPGDHMRDIHWKLSGKTDELMVIERTNHSDMGEILLLELYDIREENAKDEEEKHFLDDVLLTCFRFMRDTINSGIPIELVWWDDRKQEENKLEVKTMVEMPGLMMEVLDTVAYPEPNKLEHSWKKKHTGTYLWAGLEPGGTEPVHVIAKGENGAIIKKEEQ